MDYNNQNSFSPNNSFEPPTPNKDGLATASLVLGIIGVVCCGWTSILALIFAVVANNKVSPGKTGFVKAGFILGIIGIAFLVLSLSFYIFGFMANLSPSTW